MLLRSGKKIKGAEAWKVRVVIYCCSSGAQWKVVTIYIIYESVCTNFVFLVRMHNFISVDSFYRAPLSVVCQRDISNY